MLTDTRLTTTTAEITLRDDGIAVFATLPDKRDDITLSDVKEIDILIDSFRDTHRLYLVVIKHGRYTLEARKHLSRKEGIADKIAMVAKGPTQTMLGNFFLGIYRPKIAIRLFHSAQEAERWLLS